MGEFELIARHFAPWGGDDPDVRLGIGDDGAVIVPPDGEDLVLTCDALVEGIHLPMEAPPEAWGRRLVAVNLSDLGAMGARPRWALLALTIPEFDDSWLSAFARGLGERLREAGVALVGGNTARGPRSATLTLVGSLPARSALRRGGGRKGDSVFVTGVLGAGGYARRLWNQGVRERALLAPYLEPNPPWRLGPALRARATGAIDISDGFLADLGHLLEAADLGADIDIEALPLAPGLDPARRADLNLALAGGDDYELCLTARAEESELLRAEAQRLGVRLTRVGFLTEARGLRLRRGGEEVPLPEVLGHDHVRRPP